jgi:DNA helicase-2/ATP-dependent DNA helicase PcrA
MTAFEQIQKHIEASKSFVLEAGAGSGKTYTLIQTLNYLIQNKGEKLKKSNQKIVCITYTNVAKNEIIDRIEHNELVLVSTIHEFLWSSIKQYQRQLKIELCKLNEINLEKDKEKAKEKGKALDSRYIEKLEKRIELVDKVKYNDTSFNDFEKGIIQHDDVIEIAKMMYENYPLLTDIVASKYPYIFVDEYQDTAEETIFCLIDCLLKRNNKNLVIGFYGDSHQKIYDYGIGDLEKYYTSNGGPIELVKKEENYRSSQSIVGLLNNFRKNIQQKPQREIQGNAKFIYWANHPVKQAKQKVKDFNEENAPLKNQFYDSVVHKLSQNGWIFEGKPNSKILVLANRRVAQRAGFGNLYSVFSTRFGQSTKERLLDRTHHLITFFVGSIDKKTSQERKTGLEHLIDFWNNGNQNEVIRFIKKNGSIFNDEFKHSHKKQVAEMLETLAKNRKDWKIKNVYEFSSENCLISNRKIIEFIDKIYVDPGKLNEEEKERQKRDKTLFDAFMDLSYSEILSFWKHVQNNTVFSTKHGTKGDEFENVLTVIDDTEWIQEYNFKNFFNDTEERSERKLRTRNLFYVECSRAKENLIVLCLSELDSQALVNINNWLGSENIFDIEKYLI